MYKTLELIKQCYNHDGDNNITDSSSASQSPKVSCRHMQDPMRQVDWLIVAFCTSYSHVLNTYSLCYSTLLDITSFMDCFDFFV